MRGFFVATGIVYYYIPSYLIFQIQNFGGNPMVSLSLTQDPLSLGPMIWQVSELQPLLPCSWQICGLCWILLDHTVALGRIHHHDLAL